MVVTRSTEARLEGLEKASEEQSRAVKELQEQISTMGNDMRNVLRIL